MWVINASKYCNKRIVLFLSYKETYSTKVTGIFFLKKIKQNVELQPSGFAFLPLGKSDCTIVCKIMPFLRLFSFISYRLNRDEHNEMCYEISCWLSLLNIRARRTFIPHPFPSIIVIFRRIRIVVSRAIWHYYRTLALNLEENPLTLF